jgi:hypothetical protein
MSAVILCCATHSFDSNILRHNKESVSLLFATTCPAHLHVCCDVVLPAEVQHLLSHRQVANHAARHGQVPAEYVQQHNEAKTASGQAFVSEDGYWQVANHAARHGQVRAGHNTQNAIVLVDCISCEAQQLIDC